MLSKMEWERIDLREENGDGYELIKHEDLVMPVVFLKMEPEKRLDMIKNFKQREDNVLLCSYPKTGTHWMTNLLFYLLEDNPTDSASIHPNLMDFIPFERLKNLEKAKILCSHLGPKRMPDDFMRKGGKIILVTRDVKDACVSWYYHLLKDRLMAIKNISWNSFFENYLKGNVPFGSYFDYHNDWEKAIKDIGLDVLIVHYEDLKKNGLKEMQRIQQYLGINRDNERLQSIMDKCTVSNLRQDIESGKSFSPLVDENGKPFIYRKGEIGDWKNHFTVAQNERMDKIIQEKFKNSIFQLQPDN